MYSLIVIKSDSIYHTITYVDIFLSSVNTYISVRMYVCILHMYIGLSDPVTGIQHSQTEGGVSCVFLIMLRHT